MTLALSWGIQASHEMPHPIYPVSFETPFTATLSGLFCTTKLWHLQIWKVVIKALKFYIRPDQDYLLNYYVCINLVD